jgi:hypothetical protein
VPAAKNDPWANDLARLRSLEKREAKVAAERAKVLARMVASTSARELDWAGEAPWDSLLMEVAGTSRVGQRAANTRLDDSEHLVQRLPRTHAALAAGELYVPQARVIVQETRALNAELCAKVEQAIVPTAARHAPGDLRRRVQKAVLAADPKSADERHERAKEERATWLRPAEDGMVVHGALWTAVQGRRFDADLTALLGRTTVALGDTRTADQRRADVLADLPGLALELLDLLNGVLPPHGIPSMVGTYLPETPAPPSNRASRRRRRRTQVVVHVPVVTAVGLSDEPVWLDGYGWITAEQGLSLVPEAELRKACVDRTGRMVHLSEPTVPTPDDTADTSSRRQRPDRRDTARLIPPDPRAVADAIHAALLRMATEPTTVTPDDASVRVESQHDPSEALREFVDLREQRCNGPGCGVPAHAGDHDHRIPWPQGPTSAGNLGATSERCHQAKHNGWTVTIDEYGVSTWTSPGGRRYRRWPAYQPPPTIIAGRRPRPVLRPRREAATASGDGDDGPPPPRNST